MDKLSYNIGMTYNVGDYVDLRYLNESTSHDLITEQKEPARDKYLFDVGAKVLFVNWKESAQKLVVQLPPLAA